MEAGYDLCRPGPGGAPYAFAATIDLGPDEPAHGVPTSATVAGPTSDGDAGPGVVSRPTLQGENT